MFAKQTLLSASLVALLGVSAPVRAESEAPAHSDGEVRVESDSEANRAPEPADIPPITRPQPRVLPGELKKPSGRFSVGAGFSTDEQFIATATIAQDNLFDSGNHLSLHARVSARRQLFITRFADPDLLGSRLSWSADLYADDRRLPGFDRKATGGALTVSYPLDEHLRAFAGYRVEHVEADATPLVTARSSELAPPLRGGLISALRAGLVYTTLDRSDAPLSGSSIGGSIEIADRSLGSDVSFTRVHAWAQHHQPIGPFTLHVGGRFTALASRDAFGLPRNERVFLDSSSEIRGFRPDSFGPIDALGTPIGGDMKLTGSVELEVPLVRRIGLSLVGFADAGGLFDRTGHGVVGRSAGFGILWRSPIGPLRFDWAFPLDGGGPGFVFGLGAGF